jgi:glycosyltransferase involved in cell wall biosynthesis
MLPVTYLIPVHGTPIYWREALESLSTEKVDEILIIANGLDIIFAEKIREFLLDKPTFRYTELKSSNLVTALNFGLEISRNEYIARFDIDDVVIPGRTLTQYEFLSTQKNLVALGGQVRRFTNNRETFSESKYPITARDVRKCLEKYSCLAHPSVMYKKNYVLEVGAYRDYFRHAEDYDLWTRLLEVGEINNLAAPLIYYREHISQVSQIYRCEQDFATLAVRHCAKKRARRGIDLPLTEEELAHLRSTIKRYKFSSHYALRRNERKYLYFILSSLFSPKEFSVVLGRRLKSSVIKLKTLLICNKS